MKITCFFLSVGIILALAVCGKLASPAGVADPPTSLHPAFRMTASAKRALVEKTVKVRRGDSYQSVTNVLGLPTFDQPLALKDGRNIGRGLKYYAVRWDTNLVNELLDELVLVYLDERDCVSEVHIHATLE